MSSGEVHRKLVKIIPPPPLENIGGIWYDKYMHRPLRRNAVHNK